MIEIILTKYFLCMCFRFDVHYIFRKYLFSISVSNVSHNLYSINELNGLKNYYFKVKIKIKKIK